MKVTKNCNLKIKNCIYKLTFPNNKVYIGQTTSTLQQRINSHLYYSKTKKQIPLYYAINKYQEFSIDIVDVCETVDELNTKEIYWINYYNSLLQNKKGYNAQLGGNNCKTTELTKNKISKTLKEFYTTNKHPIKGIERDSINTKLTEKQVLEIRNLLMQKEKTLNISKLYSVSKAVIQQIKEGRTWKHLGEFKVDGKADRITSFQVQNLFKYFENKKTYTQIHNELKVSLVTISKYKKIWKKMQNQS